MPGKPQVSLTSRDIAGTVLGETRFREGYRKDEVDYFLDRVADALQALEIRVAQLEGRTGITTAVTPGLTSDDVLNAKFTATMLEKGYDQDAVDEFLDEVVEVMRQLESRLG